MDDVPLIARFLATTRTAFKQGLNNGLICVYSLLQRIWSIKKELHGIWGHVEAMKSEVVWSAYGWFYKFMYDWIGAVAASVNEQV